tara:strand:+ start:1563 stop:2528 length:966 start_codon:yes stop_codon:yes gene_type:complete
MNNSKIKVPNLFVVGAAKSGTTALYNFLDQHPDIYMSPIKEPHFFCTDIRINNFNDDYTKRNYFNTSEYFSNKKLPKRHIAFLDNRDDYFKLFREHKNEKYLGEVSNGYLYSKVAAHNIYNYNPDAKIIMILRDPCERAFSHCRQEYIFGNESDNVKHKNFTQKIINDYNINDNKWGGESHIYIQLGLYYNQVKRYYDLFPKENIKILLYDELKNHPEQIKHNLFKFLNLEIPNVDFSQKFNSSIVPKNSLIAYFFELIRGNGYLRNLFSNKFKNYIKKTFFTENKLVIHNQDKEIILNFFTEDIKKLEELIEIPLTHWLE